MFIKKGKTNWIYIGIVFVSAVITGICLVSCIGGETVEVTGKSYGLLIGK